MVSLLYRNKKNTESLFPHLSEYHYDGRPGTQDDPMGINHLDQFKPRKMKKPKLLNSFSTSITMDYIPLSMSKKGSLFTSANVTPGDHLTT